MHAVRAIRLSYDDIHELAGFFCGAHDEAALQGNIGDDLVCAFRRSHGPQLVKLEIFGSRIF